MAYVMPIHRKPAFAYCVGIDPDKAKSGVAVWCYTKKTFVYYDGLRLLDLLKTLKPMPAAQTIVWIDAGWLNEGMYKVHKDALPDDFDQWSTAAREAYMWKLGSVTGTNFGIGHAIAQLLEDMGFVVKLYKPSSAKWTVKDVKQFTGIKARMNQDVRDAIKIAFVNK